MYGPCIYMHMLIKLLIDVDSDGMFLLGLVWFALGLWMLSPEVFGIFVFDIVLPYKYRFNGCSTSQKHMLTIVSEH